MLETGRGILRSVLGGHSKTKEGLKVARGFLKTLVKILPECVDDNPVKMALSIVKAIVEFSDAVGENDDALAQGLKRAMDLLKIGEMPPPDIIKEEIGSFKRVIEKEKEDLVKLTKELKLKKILDYERYRGEIAVIIQRMNDATFGFKLEMQVKAVDMANKIYDDIKKIALDKLNPCVQADYRTTLDGQGMKREICTPGTRVLILDDITSWANNPQPNIPRVYWLTGQAGSGKTTIASTIANMFADGHAGQGAVLAATFFCSQQYPGTQSVSSILPTIAYQLARKYQPYAHALHSGDKFDSANHPLSDQMKDLLVKPWGDAQLPSNLPRLLVILDALDELDGFGGSRFLKELLVTVNRSEGTVRGLKFLVTSRTEPEISALCATFQKDVVCRLQDVPLEEADADIGKYLAFKLPEIAKNSPALLRDVQERAEGLFIYAATVVKYLGPQKRLTNREQRRMLTNFLGGEISATVATSPIDQLYRQILHTAFNELSQESIASRLSILHTFLCAAERIPSSTTAVLLGNEDIDDELTELVLTSLHAVLYRKDDRVFWYHASFPDFIFDQSRSNFRFGDKTMEFWCDKKIHHGVLATGCFRIMAGGLRFNICDIQSSFVFDDSLDPLRIDQNIPRLLQYASHYWAEHLSGLESFNTVNISPLVSEFLSIRVLFWIEVMNLLKSPMQCTQILQRAQQWASQNIVGNITLASNLIEITKFATYFFGSPAAESTPHLYISALATWRHDSALTRRWKDQFARIPAFTHSRAGANVPLMTVDAGGTTCVAFLGHSKHIVSGSLDGSLWVWDAFTGTLLHTLEGHTGSVTSVACSNDGRWIVSGSYDKTILMWDASTGTELELFIGHTGAVSSVALSADAARIVSGSHDKSLRLWDSTTGMELKKLLGHESFVTSVAISGDGSLIVSGSGDKSVRVWDAATGTQSMNLSGQTDWVRSVSISRDAKWIVSGSDDSAMRVWDAVTGQQLHELLGHTGWMRSVVFSNDGQYIVSGSNDGSTRIWDAATGKEKGILQRQNNAINSVAISLDGTQIVSASNNSLHMWDATRLRSQHLDAHTDAVYSIAVSTDGTRIVSGSRDHSMRVWTATIGDQMQTMHGHTGNVNSVSLSSDGTRIASGSDDKSVRLWEATTGKQLCVMNGHTDYVFSVSFSRDGTMIASGSKDASVQIWDTRTGQQLHVLDGHRGAVYSVAFSQDGTRIVSGSQDESVRVWDAITGAELQVMNHKCPVWSVAMSTNGRSIASGRRDGSVQVWDTTTGNLVLNMTGHRKGVGSVSFSADGTKLVSGSSDRSVRVWDAKTGAQLHNLNGHTDRINSVAISSDGKRIVSASSDHSIRVWTLDQRQWILDKSNWIVSLPDRNRLMWVPPAARVCKNSYLVLVICPEGSASVDFEHTMMGTDWHSCYKPISHLSPV